MCEFTYNEADLDLAENVEDAKKYADEHVHRAVTFWYDEGSGELYSADWSEEFLSELGLMVIDVLQDITAEIQEKYEEHHHEYFYKQLSESCIWMMMKEKGLTREQVLELRPDFQPCTEPNCSSDKHAE